MKRVSSASAVTGVASQPAVNDSMKAKFVLTSPEPAAVGARSPKSRDGYEASQSEEEEEEYDSGEGSSVPGSASIFLRDPR